MLKIVLCLLSCKNRQRKLQITNVNQHIVSEDPFTHGQCVWAALYHMILQHLCCICTCFYHILKRFVTLHFWCIVFFLYFLGNALPFYQCFCCIAFLMHFRSGWPYWALNSNMLWLFPGRNTLCSESACRVNQSNWKTWNLSCRHWACFTDV